MIDASDGTSQAPQRREKSDFLWEVDKLWDMVCDIRMRAASMESAGATPDTLIEVGTLAVQSARLSMRIGERVSNPEAFGIRNSVDVRASIKERTHSHAKPKSGRPTIGSILLAALALLADSHVSDERRREQLATRWTADVASTLGYTDEEIAERLKVKPSMVAHMIHTHRASSQKNAASRPGEAKSGTFARRIVDRARSLDEAKTTEATDRR